MRTIPKGCQNSMEAWSEEDTQQMTMLLHSIAVYGSKIYILTVKARQARPSSLLRCLDADCAAPALTCGACLVSESTLAC